MNILIAYDGSACADEAIDDLAKAGLPSVANALVLTVAEVYLPEPVDPLEPTFPEQVPTAVARARDDARQTVFEARKLAERGVLRLRDMFPSWTISADAKADSAAWGIIASAEESGADLIVLGSRGRSTIERLILGSVSQKVLVEAHCSVRIGRASRSRLSVPPRIILATDGSNAARAAERAIASRSWPVGSQVRVLSVIDSSAASAVVPRVSSIAEWYDPADTDGVAWIYRMVESKARSLRETGLEVSTEVVSGSPKERIVEEVESWKADCLFVGSTGLRGLERFLIGSVSSAVAARAECSVEIVRRKPLK